MSDAARSGFIKDNRYQILKTLGQGGFGVTYLAHDALLNRKAVIKEMFLQGSVRSTQGVQFPSWMTQSDYQQYIYNFVTEARALAKFNSPHVVRVQDVFEWDGTAFLVMDYLEGHTLMDYLRQKGKLPPAEALRMARQLAQALDIVHQAGLLHRDIKPDNIFLTNDGTPVLIDFGAAREFQPGGQAQMSVILTQGFAPIEQYSQNGKFGPYTDLYALAATLLFAVTAKVPPVSVERLQEDLPLPEIPPQYAPGFRQAVIRGLGVRPADRPADARAFLALLDEARDDFGAWELAEQIQQQGEQGEVRARLVAQALLVVFCRQQRQVPTVQHVDELRYALEQSLALLPVWQEGLRLIYGNSADLPALLAADLEVAVDRLSAPEALTEFIDTLAQVAALPALEHLHAPTTQWQAPQERGTQQYVPMQAKFAEFRLIRLADRPVQDLGFLNPSQGVYTLSDSGELSVFHGVTGDLVTTVKDVLASAGNDQGVWVAQPGRLQQFGFQGQKLAHAYPFPDQAVSLAVSRSAVAAVGQNGMIQLSQDTASQVYHWTELNKNASVPHEIQFSPDNLALLVRDERSVSTLNPKTLRLIRSFGLESQSVTAFALSPDGQRIATAHGHQIVLWDFQSGRVLQRLTSPGTGPTSSLFFNPTGAILGILSDVLYLVHSTNGKVVAVHQPAGGRAIRARISSSGRMIALGGIQHAELLHLSRMPYQALPGPNVTTQRSAHLPAQTTRAPAPPSEPVAKPSVLLTASLPLASVITPPREPTLSPAAPPTPLATFGASFMSLKGLPSRSAPPAAPASTDVSCDPTGPGPVASIQPSAQPTAVVPYQECRLPPQADVNLTARPLRHAADLLLEVIRVEGPVSRQEAYRRVVNAHGLGKVGSKIAHYLDAAVELLDGRGLVFVRGDFLWLKQMDVNQPPVRDRQALSTRAVDLVCDEELLAAARIVRAGQPDLLPDDQAIAINRLLGFSRLTAGAAQRIRQLLERPLAQADVASREY